ncbi:MAG TPA: trypsin-like peptidase domain-containing protein [Ktedonobacteraceae bacterium]|nr:trypsin-like peptidase domain-containing protein [Ktedonobacteraceae bacterium]
MAVLKINTSKRLFTLPIGDSSRLQVGESVLALGYPLGVLPQTVTGGLISALNYSTGSVIGATQTDAAINRGNSGGALVNMHAQLIGMPVYTAQQAYPEGLISITIPANGIAFAIPSNRVAFAVPQLIRYGRILRRGHGTIEATGATVVSVDPEVAAQDALSVDHGALITNVSANSAAARAGLMPGDVIVQVNGTPVDNALALNDALMTEDPGSFVTFGVVRGTEHVPVKVELQEQKVTPAASTCPPANPGPIRGRG